MREARPYQLQAKRDAYTAWREGGKNIMLVMATGTGKTYTCALILGDVVMRTGKKVLFLAHRQELIQQSFDAFRAHGLKPAVEMGNETHFGKMFDVNVVIGSVQSVAQRKRLAKFNPEEYALVVIDECFPAGVRVDGRPIESWSVGDHIRSFNHATQTVESRPVRRVFKRRAERLVMVTLSDGRVIPCTPEHPFWDGREYAPAISLHSGSVVYSLHGMVHQKTKLRRMRDRVSAAKLEPINGPHLLKDLPRHSARASSQGRDTSMPSMRQAGRMQGSQRFSSGKQRSGLLFRGVSVRVPSPIKLAHNGDNQPQVCIGSDEGQQPNEQTGNCRENARVVAGQDLSISGRQWAVNVPANRTGRRIQPANGICDKYSPGQASFPKSTPPLQGRYCRPRYQTRHRDRRPIPQAQEVEVSGCPQNESLECVRVESVEVLERGSGSRFSSVCPDGFVYNLEVGANHNYFVEDVLVHNCHHSVANSYRRIVDHFSETRTLGLTATPYRSDKVGLKNVFDRVAFQYPIQQGIEEGYLCPVRSKSVEVQALHLERVRVVKGEFDEAEISSLLLEEETLQQMVVPTIELTRDRPTIVFCENVEHAKAIGECFNRALDLAGGAVVVYGAMSADDRRVAFNRFETGRSQYLVNVGIAVEGYDHPPTASIALFRPMKSLGQLAQCVGRGTRIADGKTDCLVLDFTNVGDTVETVNVLDVLDGTMIDRATKKKAKEYANTEDAMTALKRAKYDMANLAKIHARMTAVYRATGSSLMDLLGIGRARGLFGGEAVTHKQRALLQRFGVEVEQDFEKGEAMRLIDAVFKRQKAGLCTIKQAKILSQHGVSNAWDLDFNDAKIRIAQIVNR